ncbi:GTP-binding protein [Salipaludibacillus agaradhaerens]|uniref:GTP-binding protein n=1 Tax=Salipaludibacillus agaradhaerens TaxID=76935 RepID=UPI000997347A|nr:GTP-binding protein [Salipaludibacillus agaradhaerens]
MTDTFTLPITLVTGMTEQGKTSLIKQLNRYRVNTKKVIHFRDPNSTYRCDAEGPYFQKTPVTEVFHDMEATSYDELMALLYHIQSQKDVDEIIVTKAYDSNLDLLLYDTQKGGPFFQITHHIHVIDAVNFWFQYSSKDTVQTKSIFHAETVDHTIGELLVLQLELADSLYISNEHRLNEERLNELIWFLKKLNPLANIMTHANFNKHTSSIGDTIWPEEHKADYLYRHQLQAFKPKSPLALVGDYGIETFIYQSNSPASLSQLKAFFSHLPDGILRTKGVCYTPFTHESHTISQVGASVEIMSEDPPYVKPSTSEYLTEFLFIGQHLNPQSIREKLDICLSDVSYPLTKEH